MLGKITIAFLFWISNGHFKSPSPSLFLYNTKRSEQKKNNKMKREKKTNWFHELFFFVY
jgi:hypothetical protein